jgi:hypothetical protein
VIAAPGATYDALMSDVSIRVWLEPGYDYGRFGAWVLDLPGCFVWAGDREGALAAVPSAVERFGAWLEGHGERIADAVGSGGRRR